MTAGEELAFMEGHGGIGWQSRCRRYAIGRVTITRDPRKGPEKLWEAWHRPGPGGPWGHIAVNLPTWEAAFRKCREHLDQLSRPA